MPNSVLTFTLLGDDVSASRAVTHVGTAAEATAAKSVAAAERSRAAWEKIAKVGEIFAIGEVFKTGFEAQADYQKGLAQLEAGLKSTGDVAGLTAEDMEKLADKISGYSGQSRDSIVSTEQLLLAFHNVRDEAGKGNDIFTRTTQIAADMAARLGGDASSQAIKLGKALEDPIHGTSTLTRVGVQFTVGQKALIKSLVESGNTLGAQKVILDALDSKFAGSAKAVGNTLPGEINKAKNAFREVSGEIVSVVSPALNLAIKGVVGIGHAAFTGITFLKEHQQIVIAVAAAYAALKFEAIASSIASFVATGIRSLDGLALRALYAGDALRTLGSGSLLMGGLLGGAALAGVGLITFGLLHMSDGAAQAERNVAALTAGLDLTKLDDIATGIARVQTQLNAPSKQHAFDVGLGGAQERILEIRELQKLTDAQEAARGKMELITDESAQLSRQFGISTIAVRELAKANKIDLSANVDDVTKKFDALFKIVGPTTDSERQAAAATSDLAKANTTFNTQVGVVNKALGGQIDLLAGISNQSKLTGAQLIQQAESSLIAIAQETTNIQQLTAKGLDPTTIKALVDKGPEYVQAANSLSVQDLQSFGATYHTELQAQWERSVAIVKLGSDSASRAAVDAVVSKQGAMDGATGKIASSITLALLHAKPEAYAQAQGIYTLVQGQLDKLHGKELQVVLDDLASGNIFGLIQDLQGLAGQMASLKATNVLGVPGVQLLLNNSRYQAAGGIEKHDAQIAPAGAWRIWAEPETGGEAYIPLAPSKRGRSIDIWKQVGNELGVRFAAGGILAPNDMTSIGQKWQWSQNDSPLVGQMSSFDGAVRNAISNVGQLKALTAAQAGFDSPGSVGGSDAAKAYAMARLAQLGQLDQWPALLTLWNHESGWNPYALNSIGAMGIPQAYGHGNVFALGDWRAQVDWGLNYIEQVYGGPAAAWAQWYKPDGSGSYALGGLAKGWARVGEQGPEMIHLNSTSRVMSARESAAMGGGDEFHFHFDALDGPSFDQWLQRGGAQKIQAAIAKRTSRGGVGFRN